MPFTAQPENGYYYRQSGFYLEYKRYTRKSQNNATTNQIILKT